MGERVLCGQCRSSLVPELDEAGHQLPGLGIADRASRVVEHQALIGGAGLFTVLTGFNVPQLNMSFWGENPYAVKRDVIETTMNWIFAIVALVALMIQLWAEIWGAHLPERSHDSKYYISFSVGGLIAVGVMVWVLTGFGNWIARLQWQPTVVALQRELFDRTKFVVEHAGWTPEHWVQQETITRAGDSERYKTDNLRAAGEHLSQIEDLFEVKPQGDFNFNQRVAALQPLFSK